MPDPSSFRSWVGGRVRRLVAVAARFFEDLRASDRKYAFRACSARLARSAGSRIPSGSTSRSKRSRTPS